MRPETIRSGLIPSLRLLLASLGIVASLDCKSDTPAVPGPGPNPSTQDDYLTLAENGGIPVMHREASGLPDIDCEPRVDWAASQVVLWDHFTGGDGPSGYELLLDIMFPVADSVGTYTVHDDFLQAIYYDGEMYWASPIVAASSGRVVVTRSDSRIEGTFQFTVVDSTETNSIQLSGTFGVDSGWSLTCP